MNLRTAQDYFLNCCWDTWSLFGVERHYRGKEQARMSEQAQKVKNKNIPQWAQGLYYNSGLMKEVLVYHDDEAIYFEHRGKESGIMRFTFEMIEGLNLRFNRKEFCDELYVHRKTPPLIIFVGSQAAFFT